MKAMNDTPIIQVADEKQEPLGRYGHMRDEYLRKNQNLTRTLMFAHGELDEHLREVDRQAWERMDVLMEGMTSLNPPPDKSKDFLGHIAHLNMLQALAEEIVYQELIAV